MALTEATRIDAQEISERIANESARVFAETGKGGQLRVGGIEAALAAGDRIFISRTGVEPGRITLWLHRVPGQGVYVQHGWGPSTRQLGILRFACQTIIDQYGATTFGHYPNVDMPLCVMATALLRPATGAYRGNVWTPAVTGRICRIRVGSAMPLLIAAGAPVDP